MRNAIWIVLLTVLFYSIVCARYEAEDGRLDGGVNFANSIQGYSGRGYVTNFVSSSSQVTVGFDVQAGVYEVDIGYHAADDKGFNIEVNGEGGNGFFKASGNSWGSVSAGKYYLSTNNSITISQGWGWYEVDYVDIKPAIVTPPLKPSKQLSDSKATPESKSLFSFLVDIYGQKVLSGNYDQADIAYVKSVTGQEPAVGGFDLMDYSPSRVEHGANATGQVESDIAWALKTNGLVTLSWHWNAPMDLIDQPGKEWWRGFYTDSTTYDINYALQNQNSQEYSTLIRDLDAIATQIKKFSTSNTPLLWRPLHEASGGWFWWGAKGSAPFVQLWRLMYDRFVNYHGLHHLIWVYTSAVGEDPSWYPGDQYVDVIGLDIYTTDGSSMSGSWDGIQSRFNGKKLVTLSETGTLIVPVKTRQLAVWWSWFEVWGGVVTKISSNELKAVYADSSVLKVGDLPDWRHYPA